MELNDGLTEKNRVEGGTLYLVSTPIGNLADISERAVKVLREADFIAAEDTRVTAKLLSHLSLNKPQISYHEHNKRACGETLISRLQNGESCALVTDAGTPGISDPGADMVRLCVEAQIPVTAVPGCCALIDALVLSGMDTRRFVFEGFLESRGSARREYLESLRHQTRTIIFYESPHDLTSTLADLREVFGNRHITLCRELTKRNEEIFRTDLDGAVSFYTAHEPRGEYVLILEGAPAAERFWDGMSVREHVDFYLSSGLSKMDAAKAAARDRGVSKSVIYKELL